MVPLLPSEQAVEQIVEVTGNLNAMTFMIRENINNHSLEIANNWHATKQFGPNDPSGTGFVIVNSLRPNDAYMRR